MSEIKIKSQVLVDVLESYVLGLKKNISTDSNIDSALINIIVIVRKLDLCHNDKLQLLNEIVLPKQVV